MSNYVKFAVLKARGIVSNRTTLQRWIRENDFPKPYHLGPNSTAWSEEEILDWLKSRKAP